MVVAASSQSNPIVSVIIPVGRGEIEWRSLVQSLAHDSRFEIILCTVLDDPELKLNEIESKAKILQTSTQAGRGRQLNAGAALASCPQLWFLHADTKLSSNTTNKLFHALSTNRKGSIWYFDISFYAKENPLLTLNEIGAWIRSRVFHLPFGDQGYCLSSETFRALSGFSEKQVRGEDHLFIWNAHRLGVKVLPLRSKIETSARRYNSLGWLSATTDNFVTTWSQAAQEFLSLCRSKSSDKPSS